MKRKTLSLLSMLLVLMFLVVGCTSGSKTSNNVQDPGSGDKEEPGKTEVTLKYWAAPLASNERVIEVWSKALKGLEDEAGIKVDIEVIPWADVTKKVTTAVTSGVGPDIVGTGNNMSVQLSPTGALLPLTPERMERIGGADKFYPNVVGEEGKDPVTISLNSGVHLLVYNVEAFKSIGMDEIPEDWDTFIKAAQELTRDTDGDGKIDVYGFGMFGKPTQSWKMFYNRFVQHGGQLLDAEGIPGFKSQAGRETLQFIGDMIAKYKIVPPAAAEWTQDDMVNAFINGQIMAGTIDNETIGTLKQSSIKDNFMVAELPYILPGKTDGIRCTGHTGGTNLGIFSKTSYEEECLKFLEYVTRPEINEQICSEFGVLPSVKAVFDNKELDPITQVQVDALNRSAVTMPMVPYFLPSINATASSVQNIMFAAANGNLTTELIDMELEVLDSEVRAYYDQYAGN